MLQMLKCMVVIAYLGVMFFACGGLAEVCLRIRMRNLTERVVMGMFAYFLIVQLVLLPPIFMSVSVTRSAYVYVVAMLVVFICYCLFVLRPRLKTLKGNGLSPQFQITNLPWKLLLVLVVLLVILFACLQVINGWDVGYHVGNMNSALTSDRFYKYDGNSGTEAKYLSLHYALSSFYVHFTVLASLLHIPARMMAFFCIAPICIILSCMIAYLMGVQLFPKNEKKSIALVFVWLVFSFFTMADHSGAYFLFERSYEAKGYCVNVVLFALLYAVLVTINDSTNRSSWIKLGLVAWASVPISMSALMIAPCGLAIMGLAMMIRGRTFGSIFAKCFICVLPNLIYFVAYILYAKQILVIEVL